MARDRACFNPDENFVSLIMPLLRIKLDPVDKAIELSLDTLWPLVEEWAKVTSAMANKPVDIGMTEKTFSITYLTLESLALVCMHKHNPELQKALFNSGCLQWIVAKIEKLTKKIQKPGIDNNGMLLIVGEMNRCMRILETVRIN